MSIKCVATEGSDWVGVRWKSNLQNTKKLMVQNLCLKWKISGNY